MNKLVYIQFDNGFSVLNLTERKEVEILKTEDEVLTSINTNADKGCKITLIGDNLQNEDLKEVANQSLDPEFPSSVYSIVIPFIKELRNAYPMVFDGLSMITLDGRNNDVLFYIHEPKFTITNEYDEHFDVHDVIHKILYRIQSPTQYEIRGLESMRLSSTYLNRHFQHPHQSNTVIGFTSYCMGKSTLGTQIGTGFLQETSTFAIALLLKTIKDFVRGESISGRPYHNSSGSLDFTELRSVQSNDSSRVIDIYNSNLKMFIEKSDLRFKSDAKSVDVMFGEEFDELFVNKVNRYNREIIDIGKLYDRCASFKGDSTHSHNILNVKIQGKKIPLTKEEVDNTVNSYFNNGGSLKTQIINIHRENVQQVLNNNAISEVFFQEK